MADASGEVKTTPAPRPNRHREGWLTTEFEEAIENHRVSLDHLIEALARKRASQDAERRALYDRDFFRMRRAYDEVEGNHIEESYFCQTLEGGALLTRHEARRRRCRTADEATKDRWFGNLTRR